MGWPHLAWEAPNGALEDLEAAGEDFERSCSHQNQFFEGMGWPPGRLQMEAWRHLEARDEDFQKSCSHQNRINFFEGVGWPRLAWAGLGWTGLALAGLGWPAMLRVELWKHLVKIFNRSVVIRINLLKARAGLVWHGLAWAGLSSPGLAWEAPNHVDL